jgi:hypothetical protein
MTLKTLMNIQKIVLVSSKQSSRDSEIGFLSSVVFDV